MSAPRPGRLIAVVGPSGVGKDSVMRALAARVPDLYRVRRVITRPADPDSEDFQSVTPAQFAQMAGQGAFCLSWQAHGLHYAVPRDVCARVAAGQDCTVNLSRGVLGRLPALFERVLVLSLTATPAVLAGRLAHRGRESAQDIAERLARDGAGLPNGLDIVQIPNDGALDAAVRLALAALSPAQV